MWMRITCILASFNRPTWIQHSLASVAAQTHKDYELVIIDESDSFDVHSVVRRFGFPKVHVVHHDVTPEERAKINRLSVNINEGLRMATGALICYLADDDFYYPGWFEAASRFFEVNPQVGAGFGKLTYSNSRDLVYPKDSKVLFPDGIIGDPFCRLDHNQIAHRRLQPPIEWPTDRSTLTAPDGLFMREVGKRYPFHPIHAFAAVKRAYHGKNLQQSVDVYNAGHMSGPRE